MNQRILFLTLFFVASCATSSSKKQPILSTSPEHCASIEQFKKSSLSQFTPDSQVLLKQWNPSNSPTLEQKEAVTQLSRQFLKSCSQQEVIELTQSLVAFPTTRINGTQQEELVFEELATFLKQWSEKNGLIFKGHDNNTVLEIGSGDSQGLVTYVMHADVVPTAEFEEGQYPPGWHTPPFQAIIEGDKLIGRGTQDNKGPIAASMVALKVLTQFNLAPPNKITILLGTDEESSWKHMSAFAKTYPASKYTISVDAEFPVVYGQNGFVSWMLHIPATSIKPSPKRPRIIRAEGGHFLTQVPGDAIMTLAPAQGESRSDLLGKVQAAILKVETQFANNAYEFKLRASKNKSEVHIQCIGSATHSSKPEQGHNALWPIALLAHELNVTQDAKSQMLDIIRTYFANDLFGNKLGVAYSSKIMGRLVSSATVLRNKADGVHLSVNMRRPNGKTSKQFERLLEDALEKLQKEVAPSLKTSRSPYVGKVHLADLNNGFVSRLEAIYSQFTGDTQSKAHSVRGGTYAKLFPGAVDFGPAMPGEKYRGHGPNEYIRLKTLAQLTQMLYETMIQLTHEEQ